MQHIEVCCKQTLYRVQIALKYSDTMQHRYNKRAWAKNVERLPAESQWKLLLIVNNHNS